MNPLDIVNTGVGTLTVLPAAEGGDIASGIAQFVPLLATGPQGFTPNLNTTVELIELAPGASPPSGTPVASFAKTDPGNETTPATWQLTMYVHRGDDGTFVMPNLEALANVTGALAAGKTVYYDLVDSEWKISDPRDTQFAACTSFTAATGTTPKQQLGSLVLPARGYQRLVAPRAQCVINPASDGSTAIKLVARIGTITGTIIGSTPALAGVTAPYVATLIPNAAAADPANAIAAAAAGTILLMAEQQTSSVQPWSTTMTDAAFTALGTPTG
jgi:hypothetical protein